MSQENKLFEKIIEDNKYLFIRNYLEINKTEILKAFKIKSKTKQIYNAIVNETNIKIEYRHFCRLLSEFKMKYIYHQDLKDITPKEKEQEYTPVKEIKMEEKEEIKENIQVKEKQVTEDKHYDENTSTLSKAELKRLKLQQLKNKDNKVVDIQANQEKFVWKPSVKE